MWWLIIVELVVALACTLAACRFYLHMLQLESYQLDGYARWMKAHSSRLTGWHFRCGLIASLIGFVLPVVLSLLFTGEIKRSAIISAVLTMVCALGYSGAMAYADYQTRQKKKLVFTGRMRRLTAMLVLVCALALGLLFLILRRDHTADTGLMLMWVPPFFLIAAAPYLVYAAAALIQPVEKAVNRKYFRMAQKKLAARQDLIKIGITGSYGKTSTKFALAAILSEKYNCLASSASVNTPMGLSRMINTELKQEHQVMIAEMGARHVGDIKELVELVHPRYGLITSVGPQHLETFGSLEKIAATKNELIAGLPRNGCAFFAADNGAVDKLYDRCKIEKMRTGIDEEGLDMRAENVKVDARGSSFTLVAPNGERAQCQTKLLGNHNISNIALCASVAYKLGLTMNQIAQGIGKIEPTPHRLQVIPGPLVVIDDAFNANPVSAKRALDVLGQFPGKHLIVTPGFVELGKDEKKYMYEFGTQIAAVCDAAILVGPTHTAPIREGLLAAGFSEKSIFSVNSLDEGTPLIRTVVGQGDVVLFENDLPDNYTE